MKTFKLLSMLFIIIASVSYLTSCSAVSQEKEQASYLDEIHQLKVELEKETADAKIFYDCNFFKDTEREECLTELYQDLGKIQQRYKKDNIELIAKYNKDKHAVNDMIIFFSMLDPNE